MTLYISALEFWSQHPTQFGYQIGEVDNILLKYLI